MKRKRFSVEQIAYAIAQSESGTAVTEICRQMGVSEPTFYRWKKKYSGMGVSEVRRLQQSLVDRVPSPPLELVDWELPASQRLLQPLPQPVNTRFTRPPVPHLVHSD